MASERSPGKRPRGAGCRPRRASIVDRRLTRFKEEFGPATLRVTRPVFLTPPPTSHKPAELAPGWRRMITLR